MCIWAYAEKVFAAFATKAIAQRLAKHRIVLILYVTIKRYSSVMLPMRKLLSQIAQYIVVSFFATIRRFRPQAKQNRFYIAFQLKSSYDTRRHDKVRINYRVLLYVRFCDRFLESFVLIDKFCPDRIKIRWIDKMQ